MTQPCLCHTCQNQQDPHNPLYCSELQDDCSGKCAECSKVTSCDKYTAERIDTNDQD